MKEHDLKQIRNVFHALSFNQKYHEANELKLKRNEESNMQKKQQTLMDYRNGLHILSILMKQLMKKSLLKGFAAIDKLTTESRFVSVYKERKLCFSLPMLLNILDNHRLKSLKGALTHLKSVNYCSLSKLRKLKQEKDREIEQVQ